MTELELKERWSIEKPLYQAWGGYIVKSIIQGIENYGIDPNLFLKIPASCRLKDDESLIDKAFYRPDKNYSDPYEQIEDKVGARFVVLLLDDIKKVCQIVEDNDNWIFDACKHFDEDKKKSPLLFTYQSVHYILKPKSDIVIDDITVPGSITCEVQIRTLLQHAHAELTHDAIYKAKKTVQPEVHRTVAKSMALIETTDDFFTDVTRHLNHGPLEEYNINAALNGIYLSLTNIEPHNRKSSVVLWDEFENLIDDNLVQNIRNMLALPQYSFLESKIKERYLENSLYPQSIVLFIYWMLIDRRQRLLRDWPFQRELLNPLAIDLGVNITDE